jgi:hypothetical protein
MPEPPGPDIPGGGFGHMIHVSSDCTCQSSTDPRGYEADSRFLLVIGSYLI